MIIKNKTTQCNEIFHRSWSSSLKLRILHLFCAHVDERERRNKNIGFDGIITVFFLQ